MNVANYSPSEIGINDHLNFGKNLEIGDDGDEDLEDFYYWELVPDYESDFAKLNFDEL